MTVQEREDAAFDALCDLVEAYAETDAEWDEEYAEEAAFGTLDRLICSGRTRRSDARSRRYQAIAEEVQPLREAME